VPAEVEVSQENDPDGAVPQATVPDELFAAHLLEIVTLVAVTPLVALKVVKAPDCGVVDPSPAPGAAQLTFRVREPPVPPPVNPVPAVTPVT